MGIYDAKSPTDTFSSDVKQIPKMGHLPNPDDVKGHPMAGYWIWFIWSTTFFFVSYVLPGNDKEVDKKV